MRISDWSSDVCSSDLPRSTAFRSTVSTCSHPPYPRPPCPHPPGNEERQARRPRTPDASRPRGDRKSVVSGQSVSVRVDPGGRRIIKKKTTKKHNKKTQ